MNRSIQTSAFTILFHFTLIISFLITLSNAADTITLNQTIRDDGNGSIVSAGGVFELGFFSPGSSANRYLGIWYKNVSERTVIWVANRETPLSDNSSVLKFNRNNVVLMDGRDTIIWSSNSSAKDETSNPVMAQLFDTGNFVVKYEDDDSNDRLLWQSFDYPTDNILQGMKLGWDLETGIDRYLTSWKGDDDPSPGIYTQRVSRVGYPQMLVLNGSKVNFRFGPWDGAQFSGVTLSKSGRNFELSLVRSEMKAYSIFNVTTSSTEPVRFALLSNGSIQVLSWSVQTQNWVQDISIEHDACDQYAICGAYGSCNFTKSRNEAACTCLGGYEPKSPKEWKLDDWSNGCVRKAPFDCKNGTDMFVKYMAQKLPDTQKSWFNETINREECEKLCRKNCSCTGYSNIDIRQGGTGCLIWYDELLDIRDFKDSGLAFYVRTATIDINKGSGEKKGVNTITITVVIVVSVVITTALILLLVVVLRKRKIRRRLRRGGSFLTNPQTEVINETERKDLELPLFDFQSIANATNSFSQNNKLGEGGFGPVYKGILDNQQEIAVKRLSKTSRQGLDEFKNEVKCIAKLQHRNLVRLLGCCIEEGEMMLIYEYMPNKSLDSFIFDKELRKLLDWPKRYNIIKGIAKGLLYLHQDSRLRIIHRDLKSSNILLDYDMSPKISDFGLARMFGGNETAVNTAKVVGTYGYMAPEYAIEGLFSVKSDAYSFGVVVLEIVTGKKIRGNFDSNNNISLLGHAWKLYKEGKIWDLIDEAFVESCDQPEVARVVQIALLCVQPYAKDRPNMRFVVSVLGNGNELPEPKQQPGFFPERKIPESDSSSSNQGTFLSNDQLSVTFFAPR